MLLQIIHEPTGSWTIRGLANGSVAHLPSLAASVDYARRECAEKPATIEFMIDGLYAVAHQRNGWPRELVGPPLLWEPTKKALSPFQRWCGRAARVIAALQRCRLGRADVVVPIHRASGLRDAVDNRRRLRVRRHKTLEIASAQDEQSAIG
jgi:hypothetical protein